MRILSLVTFLLVGLCALAGADNRSDAKARYGNGKKLFEQGQYDAAIKEFAAADKLAPSGVNDFNIALCFEELGNGTEAVRYYRSYLNRVPDASNRSAVEASIARLDAAAAAADEEARRIAEEEARRAQDEELTRVPPPDPDGDPATDPVRPPGQPTGDPELDRVASIDVNAIRDTQAPLPAAGGGATVGAVGGGGGETGAPPPPGPADPPKTSKPIYKQWWFWVVAGVSVYVLYSIVAADSNSEQTRDVPVGLLMPSPAPAGPPGYTLWNF